MKLSKLIEAYRKEDSDFVYYYDKKKDALVEIPTFFLDELIHHKEAKRKTNEEQKLFNIIKLKIIDKENFVPFPCLDLLDFIKAKRTFLKTTSKKNRELLKNFKDDYYGVRAFIEKIEKNNLVKNWNQVMEEQIRDSIYTWNIYYDLNIFGESKKYNYCFKMMEKVAKLKPWKYFSDQDLVKINIGDTNIYVNILGQAGKCYGFVFYHGESGIRDYQMVNNTAINQEESLLAVSLQSGIGCYFNDYEELNDQELEIITNSKMKFNPGFYPSLISFSEGRYPTNEINNSQINYVVNILKILYEGLLDYLNSDLVLHFENRESLEILLHKNDLIEINKWTNEPSELVNDYGLTYEANQDDIDLDETLCYELKVDVIERCFDFDDIGKCWLYVLLVVDKDTELVIFNSEAVYTNGEKALTQLVSELKEFALANGFSKEVVTSDFFSTQVAYEALGSEIEIVNEDTSDTMKFLFSSLSNINEDNEEEEIDFDISRMN